MSQKFRFWTSQIICCGMTTILTWLRKLIRLKRLHFLILLKQASIPSNDILNFYCTCVGPVLEYCTPVFQHSLPAYLCNDIGSVQRRTLSAIAPAISYCTLKERRSRLCEKLFTSIKLDRDNKLHHLLLEKNLSTYNFRKPRPYKNFKA